MCNLYALTTNQSAMRLMLRAVRDELGNFPPRPAIYPDQTAPILRLGNDGAPELVLARWGMPSPAFALRGKAADRGITNIRNTASPHWRPYLAQRCLVPFDAFAEPGPNGPVWFTLGAARPLACFAGLWTHWRGVRKVKEGEVATSLFGFLTTEPNREVAAIHPKAMPVILATTDAQTTWLEAPWPEAAGLQGKLPDCTLRTGIENDHPGGLNV